jgi:hypothetical protein
LFLPPSHTSHRAKQRENPSILVAHTGLVSSCSSRRRCGVRLCQCISLLSSPLNPASIRRWSPRYISWSFWHIPTRRKQHYILTSIPPVLLFCATRFFDSAVHCDCQQQLFLHLDGATYILVVRPFDRLVVRRHPLLALSSSSPSSTPD